jgi:SAM domain (Sterile alpha motif)
VGVSFLTVVEKSTTTRLLAAAMQEIADWLKKFGMSEYAERFIENRIDTSVLPDLRDQHLKDLGIALGDRLKILRAIRDLGNVPTAATAPSSLKATEPTPRESAGRRQVTVVFANLVGSTALSARMTRRTCAK